MAFVPSFAHVALGLGHIISKLRRGNSVPFIRSYPLAPFRCLRQHVKSAGWMALFYCNKIDKLLWMC